MKGAVSIAMCCMALACFSEPVEYHFTGSSLHIQQGEINKHYTNHYLVVHYDALEGVDINTVKPHRSHGFMWKLVKVEETKNAVEGAPDYNNVDWAFYYECRPPKGKKRAMSQRPGAEGVAFAPHYWKLIEPGEQVDNVAVIDKRNRKRVGIEINFNFLGKGPVEWVNKDDVPIARDVENPEEDEEEEDKPKPVYEKLANGRLVQVIGYRRYLVDDKLNIIKPKIEVLPNGVAVRMGTNNRRIRVNLDTMEDIDKDVKPQTRLQPVEHKPLKQPYRPGVSRIRKR